MAAGPSWAAAQRPVRRLPSHDREESHDAPTAIAAAGAARRLTARLVAVISLLAGYLIAVWPPWLIGRTGGVHAVSALWLALFLLALPGGSELMRLREQRADALARGREEELRRQASEERLRMARDLHDVVAHNISVINVQANMALHLKDRQPDRAWQALATIHDVSKQALVELRSVLGVLRQGDEDEPRSPAAGLNRLDDLVERARAVGLVVSVERHGDPAPLPAKIGRGPRIHLGRERPGRHEGAGRRTARHASRWPVCRRRIQGDGPPSAHRVHVVILTTFDVDEYVFESLRAGAAGFLVKDTDAAEFIKAVRVAATGEALLSPKVTRRLIAEFAARSRAPRPLPGLAELTPREREVVIEVASVRAMSPGSAGQYRLLADDVLGASWPR